MTPVPVDNKRTDWPRLVANAINHLMKRLPQTGDVRYEGGNLQYYNGTDWQNVP